MQGMQAGPFNDDRLKGFIKLDRSGAF